jgi:hypothetical protein
VIAQCVSMNILRNFIADQLVKYGSTYPATSLVALRNIALYRSCNFASEDQNLLEPNCVLPDARGNANKINALMDASRKK